MIPLSVIRSTEASGPVRCFVRTVVSGLALAGLFVSIPTAAQVLTIDTSGKTPKTTNSSVDRQYRQVDPTHVDLPKSPLDEKNRLLLIRVLQAEQGFAMRPLPRGRKGLTLEANGKLIPAGESYLNLVMSDGLSSKPGERVVISDVKIEHDKIIFELNGGPDLKHRILRHVQVGVGMGNPVVADDGSVATGSRLTLAFDKHIPELTGSQVNALLAPLISFDVKTPIQAFTDTMPPALKNAILNHQVLVGMSTDMVMYAKGHPQNKTREMDGQMPFEEWIYGTPPEDVEFVRINGNRVIRVEVAKIGKPPVIYETDVVSGMMRTDGTPVMTVADNTRIIHEGDVERDPNRQSAAAPPSLKNPGETIPGNTDAGGRDQTMRPVQFPKPHPDDSTPGANPDDQQPASSQAPAAPAGADASQAAPAHWLGAQSQGAAQVPAASQPN